MLKVTMYIENNYASPDTPKKFVMKNVIKVNDSFKLLKVDVKQDDFDLNAVDLDADTLKKKHKEILNDSIHEYMIKITKMYNGEII